MANNNLVYSVHDWNDHKPNMLAMLSKFFVNKQFTDVSLSLNGQIITAHKIVLAANSSYFQTLLTKGLTDPVDPVIILKDFLYDDMQILLTYIYMGNVLVPAERMGEFIANAETLGIKGVTNINKETVDRYRAQQPNVKEFKILHGTHATNMITMFEQFLREDMFTDVTLSLQSSFFKAHRVVLAAGSEHFHNILIKQLPAFSIHNTVFVMDSYAVPHVMKYILHFMYSGSVFIDINHIGEVAKANEMLGIRGFTAANNRTQAGNALHNPTSQVAVSLQPKSQLQHKNEIPDSGLGHTSSSTPKKKKIPFKLIHIPKKSLTQSEGISTATELMSTEVPSGNSLIEFCSVGIDNNVICNFCSHVCLNISSFYQHFDQDHRSHRMQ